MARPALYVDGAPSVTATEPIDDSGLDVAIGGDLDAGAAVLFFDGDLDDLRFYARALDASEISTLAHP